MLSDELACTLTTFPTPGFLRRRGMSGWNRSEEDVKNGVRPSMDAYGHLLRRPHMAAKLGLTRRTGEPVLFNDHLTSSLARLLRREHGIPFVTRQARSDCWSVAS